MKSKKKIKEIFKRIGKISVVLFFVAVAIMLGFVFGTNSFVVRNFLYTINGNVSDMYYCCMGT